MNKSLRKIWWVIWFALAIGGLSQLFYPLNFLYFTAELVLFWYILKHRNSWLPHFLIANLVTALFGILFSSSDVIRIVIINPFYELIHFVIPFYTTGDVISRFDALYVFSSFIYLGLITPLLLLYGLSLFTIKKEHQEIWPQYRTAALINILITIVVVTTSWAYSSYRTQPIPICFRSQFGLAVNEQTSECSPVPVFDQTGGQCTEMALPAGWELLETKRVADQMPNARPIPDESYVTYKGRTCEIRGDASSFTVRKCNDDQSFYAGPCEASYSYSTQNPWQVCCTALSLTYRERYTDPPSLVRETKLKKIDETIRWGSAVLLGFVVLMNLVYLWRRSAAKSPPEPAFKG